MQPTFVPMSLGDMFDRLFKLIGKTAVRNIIIAVIILIPASIIFTVGMNDFFSLITKMIRTEELTQDFTLEVFLPMIKQLTTFSVGYLVFILAYLAATIGVTIVGCAEMSNQPLSWNDALSKTFSRRFGRVVGQQILQYLALGALFFIPIIFIGIGAGSESIGIMLLGIMILLIAGAFAVYLFIRWTFTVVAIAWEESSIFQSFGRSSFLVKGFWWRTFGILLLLTLIAQFAISIITAPVQLFAMWGFITKYFSLINSLAEGATESIEFLELFDSLGIGLGIVTFVSYALLLLITPLIPVIMYFDLRARKNEFVQSTDVAEAGQV